MTSKPVAKPGDLVYLLCYSTDNSVNVMWISQYDMPLPPRVTVKGPLLAIDGVSVADNGKYLCSTATSLGRFVATSYLKMTSKDTRQ